MLSNECATLYKKTDVSNKRVQRDSSTDKTTTQEKRGSEDYSLIFQRNKTSKTQTKD